MQIGNCRGVPRGSMVVRTLLEIKICTFESTKKLKCIRKNIKTLPRWLSRWLDHLRTFKINRKIQKFEWKSKTNLDPLPWVYLSENLLYASWINNYFYHISFHPNFRYFWTEVCHKPNSRPYPRILISRRVLTPLDPPPSYTLLISYLHKYWTSLTNEPSFTNVHINNSWTILT